jgi:O-antigen/teichoic acid export membrane protein
VTVLKLARPIAGEPRMRDMHAPGGAKILQGTIKGPMHRYADWLNRLGRLGGATGALGIRVLAAGLTYGLQVLLARLLGPAEFGTFNFAWTLITIAGFLATLGYGQIAVRFLAAYHEGKQDGLARGFIQDAFLVTALGSAVTAFLLLAAFPWISWGYGSLCCAVLLIGLAAVPFFAFTDVIEGFARAQGWTMRALAPAYLVRNGTAILGLLILALFAVPLDARLAMWIGVLATIAAAACHLVVNLPAIWRLFSTAPRQTERRVWNRAAFPTLLSDLALLARQNIDLILLGLLATPATLGIYFAATRIASLVGLVEFAIGAGFGHRFARDRLASPAIADRTYRQAWWSMAITGFGAALALAFLSPVILAFFGADFSAAIVPSWILLGAAGLRMLAGPLEDWLTMAGFPNDVWRANAISTALVAGLTLALAWPLGAIGAAIAAASGSMCATGLLFRARLKHRSDEAECR